MYDTEPQTAGGKVLWHFTMSLDGFVAGPDHDMEWMMTGISMRPGLIGEYVATTGAVLGGRRGWDAFPDAANIYGGAWSGPVFVLTHHPREPVPMAGGTTFHFVTDGIEAALDRARAAAGGQAVRLGGGVATIQEYLRAGLVDELHLAVVPVLLHAGERLFENLDGALEEWRCVEIAPSASVMHVRLRRTESVGFDTMGA